jgi:hypothetical protein
MLSLTALRLPIQQRPGLKPSLSPCQPLFSRLCSPASPPGRWRTLRRLRAAVATGVDLFLRQMFDADERVLGRARADEFVELCLNRGAFAVLTVLDEEHHEEGDDRRPRVDDELPSIREMKHRPGRAPDHDNKQHKTNVMG